MTATPKTSVVQIVVAYRGETPNTLVREVQIVLDAQLAQKTFENIKSAADAGTAPEVLYLEAKRALVDTAELASRLDPAEPYRTKVGVSLRDFPDALVRHVDAWAVSPSLEELVSA